MVSGVFYMYFAFTNPLYCKHMKAYIISALVLLGGFVHAEDISFEKEVLPLLEKRCMGCHREAYKDPKRGRTKKPKSGYRMDTAELIVGAGSENEVNIVPGDAEKSPVYKYTTLSEDDEWIMPPKEPHFTKEEQGILKDWINQGAKFGDWKVTKFTPEGEKAE